MRTLLRQMRGLVHASLVVCVVALASGCATMEEAADARAMGMVAEEDRIEEIVGRSEVHLRYDLPLSGPVPFGSVPFPDGAYLNAAGGIEVEFTSENSTLTGALVDELSELDGFGVNGPIFVEFDGLIDVNSVPESPEASLRANASIYLLDVDTNSADAFSRIPIDVVVRHDEGRSRVYLWPGDGRGLVPGRTYAAVVTTAVEDGEGQPIGPSFDFARIRDPSISLSDERLQDARTRCGPVLARLADDTAGEQEVAGLAVFRTQTILAEMEDAWTRVWAARQSAAEQGPGVQLLRRIVVDEFDELFGAPEDLGTVPHANIAEIVHGVLPTPQLLSPVAFEPGSFTRDELGELRVRRVEEVPLTLFVPRLSDTTGKTVIPVLVFVHGNGGDRGDAAHLADRMASTGVAVLAIDGPLHGLRGPHSDLQNRFTGAPTADGFGDGSGSYFGSDRAPGSLPAGHPSYLRDGLRQAALDVLFLLETGRTGGMSEFASLPLDFRNLAIVGVDSGANVALMVANLDDDVRLVSAAFAGGSTVRSWMESPGQADHVAGLSQDMALGAVTADAGLRPEWAFYQMLSDGADAMSWASSLARKPVNLLLLQVEGDEAVAAPGTRRLASALGTSDEMHEPGLSGSADGVARVLLNLGPGAHNSLTSPQGSREFEFPTTWPFEPLVSAQQLSNPTVSALDALAQFVGSWHSCLGRLSAESTCWAQVEALD